MSHVVIATFHFTTCDDRTTFLNILSSPDGLVKTRAWPGCKLIECSLPDDDDDTLLVLYERWENQSDHAAYMNMRKDSGLFDKLTDLLAGGLEGLEIERLTLENV